MKKMNQTLRFVLACSTFLMICAHISPSQAQFLRVGDICQLKGQEENTLLGRGLVVGLPGTGDADPATLRALQRMMELMGVPVSLEELKNVKNVATVIVTATVPAAGSRQGQKMNCTVSAISAKSLAGGTLVLTTMTGPNPIDQTVYALASGMIDLDKNGSPTTGTINNGCQLEVDFRNAYSVDGMFTLVLDSRHASFQTASEIAELINNPSGASSDSRSSGSGSTGEIETSAKPIDQVNIEVTIPPQWQADPIEYISEVLSYRLQPPTPEASVVIDKGNNVLVIGENVLVGRVAVSIDTISIQTGPAATAGPVSIIDQEDDTKTTKLHALVDALNALKVETRDIITIIEAIHAESRLYGKLIYK